MKRKYDVYMTRTVLTISLTMLLLGCADEETEQYRNEFWADCVLRLSSKLEVTNPTVEGVIDDKCVKQSKRDAFSKKMLKVRQDHARKMELEARKNDPDYREPRRGLTLEEHMSLSRFMGYR